MEIIDAQIHPVNLVAPVGDEQTERGRIAMSADLAVASMDSVGVARAVLSADAEYCRGYLSRHPDRFAGVPWVAFPRYDPKFPVEEFIGEIGATPGMVGLRLVLGLPDHVTIPTLSRAINLYGRSAILESGGFDPYFRAARRNGLAMFVTVHGCVRQFHDVVRAHPDTVFVVDHLGLWSPPLTPDGIDPFDEIEQVLALATYPNVVVKFTGVPSLSREAYPFGDVWAPAHRYLDAFGPGRLMWGSDFTRCRTLHTYREGIDFLLHTREVSESDKQMLFSGTARHWLEWPP